jgi:hypothetical protein
MSGQMYQELFQAQSKGGFYPVEVEGTIVGNESRFRARFDPKPKDPDFGFYSFHGILEADYRRRTNTYRQAGFRELSVHSFVDAGKNRRFSRTWIRDGRNTEEGNSDEQGR